MSPLRKLHVASAAVFLLGPVSVSRNTRADRLCRTHQRLGSKHKPLRQRPFSKRRNPPGQTLRWPKPNTWPSITIPTSALPICCNSRKCR